MTRSSVNRLGICAIALGLVIGCDDTPAEMDAGTDAGAPMCATAADCDDGAFCNGPERCMPGATGADSRGCLAGEDPCDGDACDEAADMCAGCADADGDGHPDAACGGDDCDDDDAAVFPGATEVCDGEGRDEDCDPSTFGARDQDGDGVVDGRCCNLDSDGAALCGSDCNDQRRATNPDGAEICNGLDDDCDGAIDEGVLVQGYDDEDRDLHGAAGAAPRMACPGTPGFSLDQDDCDDGDPTVHAAQLEICDGVDNDCDDTVDESPVVATWYADMDEDGFGSDAARVVSCAPVAGHVLNALDCDDTERTINPAAREVCDGIDNDCNGRADFALGPGDTEDDDLDGVPDARCPGGLGADCDDRDASVHPGATEICDGLDNDCDGVADGATADALWYVDLDGDGFGDEGQPSIESCEPQPGRVTRAGDCDDGDETVHPGAGDPCDGEDGDCDAEIDENAFRDAFYADTDGDGYGDPTSFVFACLPPTGRVRDAGDCDDDAAARHPGATEACDLADDDCDSQIDEDSLLLYFVDEDADGRGAPGASIQACMPPDGYAPYDDDCDDTNGARFPGNPELCNGLDDDCDAGTDEEAGASCGLPNATAACQFATCVVASCDDGFEDCDGSDGNGCEVETDTDPGNCGGCVMACGLADTCGTTTPGICDDAPIRDITAGARNHVGARRLNTRGVVWGSGAAGGDGGAGTRTRPVAMALSDMTQIARGEAHSCARTAAGLAYCWGTNTDGQIGDGTTSVRPGPTLVAGLDSVSQVGAGRTFSCARRGGEVVCWGAHDQGQLGDGSPASTTDRRMPGAPVMGLTDAVDLYVGRFTACALRATGAVVCWGDNLEGQLGNGAMPVDSNVPVPVTGLPSAPVVEFAHGSGASACVRTASGEAWCWGLNGSGQLGDASTTHRSTPVRFGAVAGVVEVAVGGPHAGVGDAHVCVRTGAGEVFCSGTNIDGALGDSAFVSASSTTPRRVSLIDDASSIAVGYRFGCALRAGSGEVWCWGRNYEGQLGRGTTSASERTPAPVLDLP